MGGAEVELRGEPRLVDTSCRSRHVIALSRVIGRDAKASFAWISTRSVERVSIGADGRIGLVIVLGCRNLGPRQTIIGHSKLQLSV